MYSEQHNGYSVYGNQKQPEEKSWQSSSSPKARQIKSSNELVFVAKSSWNIRMEKNYKFSPTTVNESFFIPRCWQKNRWKFARNLLLIHFSTRITKLFAQLLKTFPHHLIRLRWLTEEKEFHEKLNSEMEKGRFLSWFRGKCYLLIDESSNWAFQKKRVIGKTWGFFSMKIVKIEQWVGGKFTPASLKNYCEYSCKIMQI